MRLSYIKRLAAAAVLACLFVLAGCGGGTTTVTINVPTKALIPGPSCPQADGGQGFMGACMPKGTGLGVPKSSALPGGIRYQDRSNNNPCTCGAAIKAAGFSGLIAKANQGPGFIDPFAVPQLASARAAGLAVGLYDFDWDYSIAEAQTLIDRAHAARIKPNSPNSFPLYFDVEAEAFAGASTLAHLEAQIHYVQQHGYRVGIYTASFWWTPHMGCNWPAGISGWIAGFPTAATVCGLPASLFVAHQFTDTPEDQTLWLGSSAAFATYVAGTPVPPRINHHYSRYLRTRRNVCGCSERGVVIPYDRLRAEQTATHHPHRAELKTLRHDAGLLADRIYRVAHRNNVGVWGVSAQTKPFYRTERYFGLRRREHGGVVPQPHNHH